MGLFSLEIIWLTRCGVHESEPYEGRSRHLHGQYNTGFIETYAHLEQQVEARQDQMNKVDVEAYV